MRFGIALSAVLASSFTSSSSTATTTTTSSSPDRHSGGNNNGDGSNNRRVTATNGHYSASNNRMLTNGRGGRGGRGKGDPMRTFGRGGRGAGLYGANKNMYRHYAPQNNYATNIAGVIDIGALDSGGGGLQQTVVAEASVAQAQQRPNLVDMTYDQYCNPNNPYAIPGCTCVENSFVNDPGSKDYGAKVKCVGGFTPTCDKAQYDICNNVNTYCQSTYYVTVDISPSKLTFGTCVSYNGTSPEIENVEFCFQDVYDAYVYCPSFLPPSIEYCQMAVPPNPPDGCTVSIDGQKCNSCEFSYYDALSAIKCYTYDCTNIDVVGIDTSFGSRKVCEGFEYNIRKAKIYQYLGWYNSTEVCEPQYNFQGGCNICENDNEYIPTTFDNMFNTNVTIPGVYLRYGYPLMNTNCTYLDYLSRGGFIPPDMICPQAELFNVGARCGCTDGGDSSSIIPPTSPPGACVNSDEFDCSEYLKNSKNLGKKCGKKIKKKGKRVKELCPEICKEHLCTCVDSVKKFSIKGREGGEKFSCAKLFGKKKCKEKTGDGFAVKSICPNKCKNTKKCVN